MGRFGKLPVAIPADVNVSLERGILRVDGPKGSITLKIPPEINFKIEERELKVSTSLNTPLARALNGTIRALAQNMIKGVSEGWKKELELSGTGYRAEIEGSVLSLTVGFSHPVKITAPEGISFKVEKNKITIEGINKEAVGQIAATIRDVKPPEPYKGKGITYLGEKVRRKAGKAAKAPGAPA